MGRQFVPMCRGGGVACTAYKNPLQSFQIVLLPGRCRQGPSVCLWGKFAWVTTKAPGPAVEPLCPAEPFGIRVCLGLASILKRLSALLSWDGCGGV